MLTAGDIAAEKNFNFEIEKKTETKLILSRFLDYNPRGKRQK